MPRTTVPDAWDDDWESLADQTASAPAQDPAPPPLDPAKVSTAERLAKHAEENKKLWESAEFTVTNTESYHFLSTQSEVPLKSDFKPAMRVLARKPAHAGEDIVENGMTAQLTAAERMLKAQKDREEKLRRYEEARRRILGDDAIRDKVSGKESSAAQGRAVQQQQQFVNGRGRGGRGQGGGVSSRGPEVPRPETAAAVKEPFDPNYTAKPRIRTEQRNGEVSHTGSGSSTPRIEDSVIRTPKGPDSSARGGFAARRGAKD